MAMTDIPLLGLLRERMSWLNARQDVLSQNVANADSPNYMARDLKPENFDDMVKRMGGGASSTALITTDPRHIPLATGAQNSEFAGKDAPDTDASPTGNTVSLEEEMIKVSDTQAQYQAASNLYAKAMTMMRTAIGQP
jgi:flagellar basal-body rod protein FlgB